MIESDFLIPPHKMSINVDEENYNELQSDINIITQPIRDSKI